MGATKAELKGYRLGALLKRQREMLDMSQHDIALKLEYRNDNFVSMLERGLSKIPFTTIPRIVEAYGLPAEFSAVMVKELYPEQWEVLKEINRTLYSTLILTSLLDEQIDAIRRLKLGEFGIE
jgi:transcriptional regulator with XRE-family HTH domain